MDFLLHTGLARLRVVKGARRQYELGYTQGGDHYRRIRNGIAALHRAGDGIESLWDIVEAAPAAKRDSFTAVAHGYAKWMQGKFIVGSVRPRPYLWQHGELNVLCRPEERLTIDGQPYHVKLYLKDAKVSQAGANLVIHLTSQRDLPAIASRSSMCAAAASSRRRALMPTTGRSFARKPSRS